VKDKWGRYVTVAVNKGKEQTLRGNLDAYSLKNTESSS